MTYVNHFLSELDCPLGSPVLPVPSCRPANGGQHLGLPAGTVQKTETSPVKEADDQSPPDPAVRPSPDPDRPRRRAVARSPLADAGRPGSGSTGGTADAKTAPADPDLCLWIADLEPGLCGPGTPPRHGGGMASQLFDPAGSFSRHARTAGADASPGVRRTMRRAGPGHHAGDRGSVPARHPAA